MIAVETVDLATRGVILPKERVGMVVAQPYLSLSNTEPFRCNASAQGNQLAVISETLRVALAKPHRLEKTHFTIFPEYSVPGVSGIELIQSVIESESWPTGTVIIGGIDGLTKEEFIQVAGASHTQTNNSPATRISNQEWVNCSITWIKGGDGKVERWLQPKLFPAWLEQNTPYQGMFRGDTVFVFKGLFEGETEYRFTSLICFDWIYRQGAQMAWRLALESLRSEVAPGEVSLSWLFVIQHNTQPSFHGFLNEAVAFFDQTIIRNVRRDRACLVFANTAGETRPGRTDKFGGTSLLFAPETLYTAETCPATFSNGGTRFRSSTILQNCKDVYFRERGACIHSFVQINPGSVSAGAAGRIPPVEQAAVFAVPGIIDRRAPGAEVPASIKWLLDELDSLKSLGDHYATATLAAQSKTAHNQAKSDLQSLPADSIDQAVKLASVAAANVRAGNTRWADKHPDEWDGEQTAAIEHLVHTLEIVSLGFPQPALGVVPPHATVFIKDRTVDLMAVLGNTHEECIKHAEKFYKQPNRQRLLVSRDRDNTPWHQRFGESILEPTKAHLGGERNFTDPQTQSLHLGYNKLLEIFRSASTPNDINLAIHAELAA